MSDHPADTEVDDTREHTRVSMSFADEAAFRLATGIERPNDDAEAVEAFAESSESAAITFHQWFDHLFVAYYRSTGMEFDAPILSDERPG